MLVASVCSTCPWEGGSIQFSSSPQVCFMLGEAYVTLSEFFFLHCCITDTYYKAPILRKNGTIYLNSVKIILLTMEIQINAFNAYSHNAWTLYEHNCEIQNHSFVLSYFKCSPKCKSWYIYRENNLFFWVT